MAYQPNFGTQFLSEGNHLNKQKQNSVSQSATASENSNFDCNICLDSSQDPVVTLCGHLYCWPCIYKWLQVQSTSSESDETPKCPVCKSYISSSSLVPLYGRGSSPSDSETKKPPQLDLAIPHRPPALGMNTLLAANPNQQNHANPFHQRRYFPHPVNGNHTPITPAFTTTSFYSPTINMVGEMVFAGMFGSSDTSLFADSYPRLRRQEMQLDKSLNRVSLFLFCCIALCLILFLFSPFDRYCIALYIYIARLLGKKAVSDRVDIW